MRRYILTGAPGCGKTAVIRQLEVDGFSVVEEAATDVIALAQAQGIAEPWKHSGFIDSVVRLQRSRQLCASTAGGVVQFHDRSVICTLALARYLGSRPSNTLSKELLRLSSEGIFQERVFFMKSPGFITRTEARRITVEEAARFELFHEQGYREFGFEIVYIGPGTVSDQVREIISWTSAAETSKVALHREM